jgi:Fe-S oxidoreductase
VLAVSADKLKRQDLSAPVLLWADTFNNFFHTATARAAVEVLEKLGHPVMVPKASLCCGRPLYDYGMLPLAKTMLRGEPSCAAVFRDELLNLFPEDPLARKLRDQTFLLSEFLAKHAHPLPKLPGKALVQAHCHQKSVLGFDTEKVLLEKLGLEVNMPEAGCCGMAGSFGFEKDHGEISMQIAERALLPAVRAAPPETVVIANGFSCREQISQATDRKPLHLAEVLRLAMDKN